MAATGSEIANAFVAITVKAPGIQKDIEKQLGGGDYGKVGRGIGDKLASGMKKTLKVGMAGVAAVATTALVKGFGRLKAIENAQAKMRGLGHDSDTVATAMDNALKAVQGTAYGLGEAATVASGAMAAQIKPGKELEAHLTRVSNNAAAAGVSYEEMGAIFNKAATQANGVQNDLIGQLADKGIPIYEELGKVMGVTGGEVFKLASEGKVSFEMFSQAAEAAAGTVADEMGKTTTGSFDNMLAALGRLGAKVLEDLYPLIGPFFQDVTAWLDEATVHVEPLVDAVGERLKQAFSDVKDVWQWLKDNSDWIAPVAVAVGAAAGAFVVWHGAIKTWNTITGIAKGIQLAFNAVMAANPIMVVVMAIAALVAGLIWFFTKTETGQKIWEKFTTFLREAWANVSQFFQTAWNDYIKPVFDGIATVATWLWENVLQPTFNAIGVGVAILGGIIQGLYDVFVKPALDAIGAMFKWVWDKVIKPIIDFVVAYIKLWAKIILWLWNNAVKPALDAIGKAMKWVWDKILKPVITAIWDALKVLGGWFSWLYDNVVKPVWDWISDKIKKVWENGIKPVIDTLVKVIKSDPKEAFEAARDAIGKAWDGIKELAKKPVRFVIETVVNGLIGTLNKIPGVNLKKVSLPRGFSDGGYTGNLHPAAVAGVVHGNEHVIRAHSRERIERSHPGLLDHMNRYGTVPGYRKGGMVHPLPGGRITTYWMGYPGHKGMDFAKPQGSPMFAAAAGVVNHAKYNGGWGNMVKIDHGAGLQTLYAHIMPGGFNVRVGDVVKQGQNIARVGTTGRSTGPHLHYEVWRNGRAVDPLPYVSGAAGHDGGAYGDMLGLGDWARSKFEKAFPGGGMWIDAAGGLMSEAVKSVVNWGKDKLSIGGATLFDNGGWLDPGTHLVANKTRRPEPILTGAQWDTMKRASVGGIQPGSRLVLRVGDRDFDAYVGELADGSAGRALVGAFGDSQSRRGVRF